MDLKTSNFLTTFTCIVHIHLGDILYLFFALCSGETNMQGKVLLLSYPAIKFIHFELAVVSYLTAELHRYL